MNSLAFGLIAICLLCLGYKFYARIIERLWGVDPQRKTPTIQQLPWFMKLHSLFLSINISWLRSGSFCSSWQDLCCLKASPWQESALGDGDLKGKSSEEGAGLTDWTRP